MTALARSLMSLALVALTAGPVCAQVGTPGGVVPGSADRPTTPPPARTPSVLIGPSPAPGLPTPTPSPSAPVAPVPPAVPAPAPPPARTPPVLIGPPPAPRGSSGPSPSDRWAVDPRVAPTDPRMGLSTGTILDPRTLTSSGAPTGR